MAVREPCHLQVFEWPYFEVCRLRLKIESLATAHSEVKMGYKETLIAMSRSLKRLVRLSVPEGQRTSPQYNGHVNQVI